MTAHREVLFIGGTSGRRIRPGRAIVGTYTGMPALMALALDLAPIRVNLIAPGLVDTGQQFVA